MVATGPHFGSWPTRPAVVVDLSRGIEFRTQGPPFPVVVIERATPDSVVMALADLTGHMPLPPKWALGYQQCRYSYTPDREVLRIAREFRARAIPCDVIWMDIDYMDGFRSFTFSPTAFPDPGAVNDSSRPRIPLCGDDPGISPTRYAVTRARAATTG